MLVYLLILGIMIGEYPLLNPHPSLLVIKEGGGFFFCPINLLAAIMPFFEQSIIEDMLFDYDMGT